MRRVKSLKRKCPILLLIGKYIENSGILLNEHVTKFVSPLLWYVSREKTKAWFVAFVVGEASPWYIAVSARRPGPWYRFGDLRTICQRSAGRVAAYQIYIEHRSHRVFTAVFDELTCTRARALGPRFDQSTHRVDRCTLRVPSSKRFACHRIVN